MRLHRPRLLVAPPRDLPRRLDVFGGGRAVRAMLTVAALQRSTLEFRIWCRQPSRAELLRIHLADLPPLAVEIVTGPTPPGDGTGPLVLALGLRTSRRSRQKSKDALFGQNLAIIEGLRPALRDRAVIVVTNPSTRLTARLIADGIDAYGIGVLNDQLRFERDAPAGWRLVGAHNPFELGFGWLGRDPPDEAPGFSRAAYRDLTNRQDRQRPLLDPDGALAGLAPGLHQHAWHELGALHESLDIARRWYARQRLASRYLENGIACGRAILGLADLMTGAPLERADLTIEAGLRLENGRAAVIGWPWDTITAEPRALYLGESSAEVLEQLARIYGLDEPRSAFTTSVPARAETSSDIRLTGHGVPSIACSGQGLVALLPDLVPLAAPRAGEGVGADIAVTLVADPVHLARLAPPPHADLVHVAQHRGKNAFEHRDLTIQALAGKRRLVRFGASGAVALVDDAARQIVLAAPEGAGRRDEFRKLLRDQMLTPAYAAAGAWVLHAGLVAIGDRGLLLIGDSGAGKTTGALHLLAGREGGYGASERVLVRPRGGRLEALGVPESLTIFRGSLRGLPRFADLLDEQARDEDWLRARKLRLSRDDVVARLGSHQIAEPIAIAHVALVRYAPGLAGEAESRPLASGEERVAALHANDLTTEDDVRAAWLGWFEPKRDPAVPALLANPELPFSLIDWRTPPALAAALAEALEAGS